MWERRGAAARPETGAVPAEGPSALSRRWERGARRELWPSGPVAQRPSGPAAQRVGAAVRAGCPRGPGGRALALMRRLGRSQMGRALLAQAPTQLRA